MTTATTHEVVGETDSSSRRRLPREPAILQAGATDDDPVVPARQRVASLNAQELGSEVTTLVARLSAGTYELLVSVGEVDARGAYALWGALSCAAWLADVSDVEMVTAHNQVRVARALCAHPALDEAMRTGDVSFAKARVLVPYLDDGNATELVALAEHTPASRLGAAIAARSLQTDDPEVIAARQHEARSVSWRTDPDGTVAITVRLAPEAAGNVCAAIDTQVMRADPTGPEADGGGSATRPNLAQQRADALVACVTDGGGNVQTEVVVHVREDGNTFTDGTPLADHAVGRMLPDAFVSLLIHDIEGRPIDASFRRRFPTRRQRRVVDERYAECAHPGCHARVLLQADHVVAYADGGPTVIANLQALCGPHNRAKERARNAAAPTGSTRAAGPTSRDERARNSRL